MGPTKKLSGTTFKKFRKLCDKEI